MRNLSLALIVTAWAGAHGAMAQGAPPPRLIFDASGAMSSFDVSDDGSYIVTRSASGEVAKWNWRGLRVDDLGPVLTPASSLFSNRRMEHWLGTADGIVVARGFVAEVDRLGFRAHSGSVLALALSPDERTLVSGGLDGKLKIWDADTAALESELVLPGPVAGIAFAPKGLLAAASRSDPRVRDRKPSTIHLINPKSGSVIRSVVHSWMPGTPTLAFSADGQTVLARIDGTLKAWDVDTGELRFQLAAGRNTNIFLVSPTRNYFVQLHHQAPPAVVSLTDGHPVWTLGAPKSARGPITAGRFSGDGTRIALAAQDGSVRLWSGKTLKPTQFIRGDGTPVHDVRFSPDGLELYMLTRAGKLWSCDVLPACQDELLAIERGAPAP